MSIIDIYQWLDPNYAPAITPILLEPRLSYQITYLRNILESSKRNEAATYYFANWLEFDDTNSIHKLVRFVQDFPELTILAEQTKDHEIKHKFVEDIFIGLHTVALTDAECANYNLTVKTLRETYLIEGISKIIPDLT